MNTALVAIAAYVAIQFAIGVWASRGLKDDEDYIVAGRTLSAPLVAFSVFATFFGSEALTATSAGVFDNGLAGAIVDPFCYGVAMILVGVFFAARLRARELTTFADLFRNRFSPSVERLVVLVLLPGSLFWAAAQMRVFGVVLNANAGIGLSQAILFAAVVIGLYATVGGLYADSITDLVHGVVVILGLVLLGVAVAGALGTAGQTLATLPASKWSLAAADVTLLGWLEKLLVPICGTIVAVELISRFLGARSAAVAAVGVTTGGLLYLVFGIIPIYLGLAGSVLAPDLKESEELVTRLAEAHLSPLFYVVFLGAIVSAILSTVHATLHAPASQVAHNLLVRVRPDWPGRTRLWAARATVAAFTIVAYVLAASSEAVKELVETASAFGSAGVFIAMMFGVFSSFGGATSAAAAILAGVLTWFAGRYVAAFETPYVFALVSATLAYVAVAVVERRTEPA